MPYTSTNPTGYPATTHDTVTSNLQSTRTPIVFCIPQALCNLANFNKPGLKEGIDFIKTLLKFYHIGNVEILHFITDIHNDSPWEGEMYKMDF